MATLGQMKNDLNLLSMNGLVASDVTSLLNKCQREELESYQWSFLLTDVIVNSVVPYQTGTVTVTQGSTTLTGTGTNFTSSMVGWFLWVGPTLTTPVLISGFTSATQLTLSTAWGAPTQTNVGYSIQPLYYSVSPLIEVYSVRQIADLEMVSQVELNRRDPSRIATGGSPSLNWSPAPFNNPTSNGAYQIELWPRPSSALPYVVTGKIGNLVMEASSDLPVIPSQVLEAKAMMYLCRATFANNGNPKWLQLAEAYRADYLTELEKAQTADKERSVTKGLPIIRTYQTSRPFDASIDENHDFAGPVYNGG
jgi:hypothetical protein